MRKIIFSIFGLMLLSACSNQEVSDLPSSEIVEQIQSAHAVHQSVEVKLEKTKVTSKTFKIGVLISNPEQKPLTSARTWLSYNPQELRIIKISTQNSDFNLAAPGEDGFDEEAGLIKLGRSQTEGTVDLQSLQMAEITVEKIQTGSTMLDFYNYQADETGNVNVNMLLKNNVYNLAKEPQTPALVLD